MGGVIDSSHRFYKHRRQIIDISSLSIFVFLLPSILCLLLFVSSECLPKILNEDIFILIDEGEFICTSCTYKLCFLFPANAWIYSRILPKHNQPFFITCRPSILENIHCGRLFLYLLVQLLRKLYIMVGICLIWRETMVEILSRTVHVSITLL